MSSQPSRAGALGPLRDRRFRWYFASRAVDLVGDVMGSIALVFAVLEVSDSASGLGIVLAAHSIPMVAFLLVGGVLADRFGRTVVIQVSNLTAAATQLATAALIITGAAQLWQLAVLSALSGVAAAANQPALAGLLPQLAPRDQLQSANALNALLRNLSLVVAPTVGGVLVATVGAGWAVAVNGLTYVLAAALLLPIKLPPPAARGTGVVADLREGWTYFRTTTWLWVVVVAFCLLNAIHSGGFRTLGPTLADGSELGEKGWGLVLSAGAAGLVATSLVLMRVPLRRPLLAGMLGCTLYAVPMIALGLTTQLWVVALAAFVGGVGIEIFGLGWELTMQEQVPDGMLSRVYSYDMLGSFVAIPAGQLAFGPLGEVFGLQHVLLVAGLVYAVISLLTLLSRSVRSLPRGANPASTAEAAGLPQ